MRQVECQKPLRARGTPGLCRGETTPRGEKSSGGTVCDGEQGLTIATGPLMTYGGAGGDQRRETQRLVIFGHDPLESEGISRCQWQVGIEHETMSRITRAAASQDTMPYTGALGIEHLAGERQRTPTLAPIMDGADRVQDHRLGFAFDQHRGQTYSTDKILNR